MGRMKFNNSGVVLLTVLAMSVALAVFAVSILSVNISQATSSQRQIDRIKAEQVAIGQFWRNYMSRGTQSGSPLSPSVTIPLSEVHHGTTTTPKNFTANVTDQGPSGPGGTRRYDVIITY